MDEDDRRREREELERESAEKERSASAQLLHDTTNLSPMSPATTTPSTPQVDSDFHRQCVSEWELQSHRAGFAPK